MTGSDGPNKSLIGLRGAVVLLSALIIAGIGAAVAYGSRPDVPATVAVTAAVFVGAATFLNSIIE